MKNRSGPIHHESEENRVEKLVKLLRVNPQGLSRKVVAERTGFALSTVTYVIRRYPDLFTLEGSVRKMICRLKEEETIRDYARRSEL